MESLAKLIAELHKQNINPPSTHIRTAEVISAAPIRVRWGEGIIIETDKLVVPHLYMSGYDITLVGIGQLKLKVELVKGDKVMIAPDENWKRWYIIGKVGD